jgi:undecaprenyl diphosphate synthase
LSPHIETGIMKEIDPARLPQHIAIIMDGNGRWAERHTLGRVLGHRKGAESVRTVVKTCRRIGLHCLTLYAFSSENWLRPEAEVSALMSLLRQYLENEFKEMMEQDIRLTAIGNLDVLDPLVLERLRETIKMTAGNQGMILNLALSYGGRDEIVAAAKRMVGEAQAGRINLQEITKEFFAGYLYTSGIPDPDLLIRTGGEYRISNFLLWQMAYTEFFFTDTLWPDFSEYDLLKAIAEYQRRERRFGMTSDQIGKRL